MEPISLDNTVSQMQQNLGMQPISLDPKDPSNAVIPPPDVAMDRAAKAQFGLYPDYTDKNASQLYESFMTGAEDSFRQSITSKMSAEKYWQFRDQLTNLSQRTGGPVDPAAMRGMLSMLYQSPDPESVIEKAYADEFIKHLDKTSQEQYTQFGEAKQEQPEAVSTAQMLGRDVLWYREFAQKGQQEAHEALQNQSYAGWGVDMLKNIVPFYSDAKTRGMTPDVGYFAGGALGSNWREQIAKAYTMPYPQFKEWYTTNLNRLKNDNPALAVSFADAVVGMSTSDEVWNNLVYTGADISALPIGKVLKWSAKAAGLLAKDAAKDMVRAAASGEPVTVAAAAGSGDLAKAAIRKTTAEYIEDVKGNVNEPTKRAIDMVQTAFKDDGTKVVDNAGNFGQEQANRLGEDISSAGGRFVKAALETQKVLRNPELDKALSIEATLQAFRDHVMTEYRGLRNSILNITKPTLNELTGGYDYFVNIGNSYGQYFYNPSVARTYAHIYGIKDFSLEKQGLGYYIRVNASVDEGAPWVTKVLGTTAESEPPTRGLNAWFNALAGRWRTPEETLSLDQRQNRKVATYGPNALLKAANEEIKDVKNLVGWALPGTKKRQKWNEWKQIADYAREDRDPITGERGYFKRTPAELEHLYQTKFHRDPDPQETKAYFAYTRFVEMDRQFRNLALYKIKSAWGAKNFRISLMNGAGERTFSDWFEGKVIGSLPRSDDRILLSTKQNFGTEVVKWGDNIQTALRNELEAGIKKGKYQIIELYDADRHPFDSWSKKVAKDPGRIRYVLTDKAETKGLSYDQVPRRGGGHFDFEAEHYIKQAQVTPMRRFTRTVAGIKQTTFKQIYTGDSTVFALGNRALASKLIPTMEEARKAMLAKDIDRARDLINNGNMPFDFKEFHSWFLPHKGPDGVLHKPRLNLTEEFKVVARNRLINDVDGSVAIKYGNNFQDGTKSGSAARTQQVQYTGERDVDVLHQVFDRGTKDNPLFSYEAAKLIDPITSINRAMTRIINSTFMDDYKIFAVNHWLKEAQNYLKFEHGKPEAVWDAPFFHFNRATDKNAFRPGAVSENPEIVNSLLTRRMQIQQFMGMPSTTDGILHSAAQRLADSIYEARGPNSRLDPSWALPYLSDPFRFLRSVTFHAKLGLFAVPQLLVQTQTFVNIFALAGLRHATSGTMATFLHTLSRVNKNPAILDALDNIASKVRLPGMVGWKPGEFREAMEELSKTGFEHVGGEYAIRDDHFNPKLINFGGRQFLDWGTVFFREGEKANRLGAWYTAYREWRTANPTGRVTQVERNKILERADMLSVNMSRASSSILHQGVFSIPTQFLSYQMRLAELFTGKRIDNMARARMFGWYAGLYGLPTGLGLSGIPLGDYFRKTAIDYGYTVGDNYISSLIMEGVPSMMGALATGNFDIHKGTFFNFGDRYGVQGFETLREALRSDSTIWHILGGAAFSTLANTYAQSDGFVQAMLALVKGDPQQFPLKIDDFVDLFREISSVHSNWRLVMALNTGKWLSKKGAFLDETSPGRAIFQTVSGLQPQDVSDLNLMSELHTNQKDREKFVEQRFETEFRRAMRAKTDNPTQAQAFMRRALTILELFDYPQEKRGGLIAKAAKDNESLINQINWNFGFKDLPGNDTIMSSIMDRRSMRQQSLKDKLRIQQLKGQ